MGQLTASDRDTAYVWVGRDTGGRPGPALRLLRRAGAALLGSAEAEVVLAHGPAGNPVVRVAGPANAGPVELPVSVSRAGRIVVVAARAAGPVGVDVEEVRPLPALALARRWFAPAEVAWLACRPEAGRAADFLRLWTAKEAVGKTLGLGLRGGGLLREMPPPVGPGLPLRPVPGGEPLRVGHPELGGGLVLAVAVRAEDEDEVDVEVVQRAAHGVAAERSASVERTSLPVVVRGNWSSRRSTRGRL
ncbi:4'-phosphopantetheinyl transferase superfamily protein [Micromonospora lupini]|uniref:4'-phosphopantetheinyl transferase family protein n=1 Tax=Micromonospora lupini TaxID=285679 RepID=UPI002250CAA6|nr:4'-phosphopantetheinyl transferase superfamily protein [Micromonospora lupini]MCX5065172.1 4'-phosphopantetheinyl transferase superfamily protein [Micromonospora lupini]